MRLELDDIEVAVSNVTDRNIVQDIESNSAAVMDKDRTEEEVELAFDARWEKNVDLVQDKMAVGAEGLGMCPYDYMAAKVGRKYSAEVLLRLALASLVEMDELDFYPFPLALHLRHCLAWTSVQHWIAVALSKLTSSALNCCSA